MHTVVSSRLETVQFGELQNYGSIAILPLVASDGLFSYRTLGEALTTSDILITEISGSGSVPELLVINRGQKPVLLIDGEELVGAKQDRVLNTTILLERASETRIPVSCTEQGRWAYSTPAFAESGNVMALKARALKSRSVTRSLAATASFQSDQGEVWREIAELHSMADCSSPTSAMHDVFKSRADDLARCTEVFRCLPGQTGLVAFIDRRPAGFDLFSRESAYSKLHAKLIRSYALGSLFQAQSTVVPDLDYLGMARGFLNAAIAAGEQLFPSVGCGTDYRYHGESIEGAALVHADEALHTVVFQTDAFGQTALGNLASLRDRRRFFRA